MAWQAAQQWRQFTDPGFERNEPQMLTVYSRGTSQGSSCERGVDSIILFNGSKPGFYNCVCCA